MSAQANAKNILIALGVVGALISIGALPKRREVKLNRAKACQANLTQIDAAVELWALERGKSSGSASPAIEEFLASNNPAPKAGVDAYLKEIPICPDGGKYVISTLGEDPVCTSGLAGHDLRPAPRIDLQE